MNLKLKLEFTRVVPKVEFDIIDGFQYLTGWWVGKLNKNKANFIFI